MPEFFPMLAIMSMLMSHALLIIFYYRLCLSLIHSCEPGLKPLPMKCGRNSENLLPLFSKQGYKMDDLLTSYLSTMLTNINKGNPNTVVSRKPVVNVYGKL